MAYATQLLISNSPAGTDCISVKKKWRNKYKKVSLEWPFIKSRKKEIEVVELYQIWSSEKNVKRKKIAFNRLWYSCWYVLQRSI
jgi:hypothetical protein